MAKVQQYPTGPDFLGVAVHNYYSEGLKSEALVFLFYLLYLFCSHRGVFLVYVQVAFGLRQKTRKQFVEVQTMPILKEMIQMKNHQIPIFPGLISTSNNMSRPFWWQPVVFHSCHASIDDLGRKHPPNAQLPPPRRSSRCFEKDTEIATAPQRHPWRRLLQCAMSQTRRAVIEID